jgi:uncharacterized coiled-coil protein SlyX
MGMADDAVDVLDDILQNGTSEQVRLKAVEMVLNRSGIKDAVDLNVQVTHNVSAAEEIRKKLSAITERMKADEPEDIIDAEEVDDEEKEL